MNVRKVNVGVIIVALGMIAHSCIQAQWAEATLKDMSRDKESGLRKKIGQLIMIAVPNNPEKTGITDRLFTLKLPQYLNRQYAEEMVTKYHVGGVLYICEGTMPEQVQFTNHLQAKSELPLLVAQDFEPGLNRLDDAVRYPRAEAWGAAGDTDLTNRLGKELGLRAKRLGVHVVFAPVVDVRTNKKNPIIHNRSFGESPSAVAEHGAAFMRGVQGEGIIACAKHFPGHGDASADSHLELPQLPDHTMGRLDNVELVPFKKLIEEGVDAVMPAHLLIPKLDPENPSSLSPLFLKTILQEKLGFKGLIFSDALIMKAITDHTGVGQAALRFLLAGGTVAVFPDDVPKSIEQIQRAVVSGEFSVEALDAKVLAVLQAKERLELHLGSNRLVDVHNVVERVNTVRALALQQEIQARASSSSAAQK